MELLLTVTSYGGLPPDRPASLRIGAGGCSLGRNPGNDLALSDPERLVSGVHARIELRTDGAWLTDKSTNGTFLNHDPERLPAGHPVQIRNGDTLSIGPYEISVALVAAAQAPSLGADLFAPAALSDADPDLPGLSTPGQSQDIMALLGGAAGQPAESGPGPASNPFADARPLDSFLAGPAPAAEEALATPRPTSMEHAFYRPPDTEVIPDDYNILDDLYSAPAPRPGVRHAPESADAFQDHPAPRPKRASPNGHAPGPNDHPDGKAASAAPQSPALGESADPLDLPVASTGPEGLAELPVFADPFAFTDPQSPAVPTGLAGPAVSPEPLTFEDPKTHPEADPPTPAEPGPAGVRQPRPGNAPRPADEAVRRSAAATEAPAIPGPPTPEVVAQPSQAQRPSPALQRGAPDVQAGLATLLAGLETGDPEQIRDPESFLRDSGALLRTLAAGLTATMMVRARFKSEMRLGMTALRPTENNPFKFSVGADEALERLLLRPNPGFMPAVQAAQEAFDDIQAHEMAIIAGLRAALRALLARFEPAVLEARLDPASGFDKLLPMARKSRYWEQFTEAYGQVAADAEEDFLQLFGEAFANAYEDQIQRLTQARKTRRRD
jgi:type VI secretion system protein